MFFSKSFLQSRNYGEIFREAALLYNMRQGLTQVAQKSVIMNFISVRIFERIEV